MPSFRINLLFFFFLLFPITVSYCQNKPKIVVGIVVDQLSNDYLNRYENEFGQGGFKRLLEGGFNFPNTCFGYAKTSTGPGHATIYSGCNPALHGIVENAWPDKDGNGFVHCVKDKKIRNLDSQNEGGGSPVNLIGATITDMLSLSSGGRSKVMGIALKDRSAILPVGHRANLALWWNEKSGKWTSSTYYTSKLPTWVDDFEKLHPAKSYLAEWKLSQGEISTEFQKSHSKYEEPFPGLESSESSYNLSRIAEEKGIGILRTSPFGNTYTLDLARTAIEAEGLGTDEFTDFLALSFSSTDYIGHRFGPYSDEVKDTYIRLDKDLSDFFIFLDARFGSGNYLLFLTSDHGVVPNVDFLGEQKIPGGHFLPEDLMSSFGEKLKKRFGVDSLIKHFTDDQIFLDRTRIEKNRLKATEVQRELVEFIQENENVLSVLTSHDLLYKDYHTFPKSEMQQSYFHGRSGDIFIVWKPFIREGKEEKGTGHGSVYNYDRCVPLIWMGGMIKHGRNFDSTDITSIAATLADLLRIPRPPACTAPSLAEYLLK